ncbi:MAG: hypothetical protein ACLP1Y_04315 [Candidatus Acidiferrales bacterium]
MTATREVEKIAGPVKISEAFAFVYEDDAGIERNLVMAIDGVRVPVFTVDEWRLPALRRAVRDLASEGGKPIRLLKFTRREEVEVIQP